MLRHVDIVLEGQLLVHLNNLADQNDEELETLIVAILEDWLQQGKKGE